MGEKPTLSICIPTYNRAAKLNNTLGEISREIRGLSGKVEICISDNCSSDNTQQVIAKWKKILHVSSRKNSTNMGYDANAALALQLANGKFAMFSGDDDSLVPGSIARLVADLSKHDGSGMGAVYLNSLKCGSPQTAFGFSDFRVFPKNSRGYSPISLSFGGAVCVRTEIAKKIMRKKLYFENNRLCKREDDKFLLFDFIHTYLFLECASSAGSFGVEPSCVVEVQGRGQSISITKRFYFDLVFNIYYMQLRKSYPWMREAMFLDEGGIARHILRRYAALSYMLTIHPELSDAFLSNFNLSLKILQMENHLLLARLLGMIEPVRRAGLLDWPAASCVKIYRHLSGRKDFLSENIDNIGTPPKAVEDLFARAKKYA